MAPTREQWTARIYKRWGFQVPEVGRDQYLEFDEAQELLGLGSPGAVRSLLLHRHVEPCTIEGRLGVTRDSVEAELRWRQTAAFPARLRRLVGHVLHWLSF